MLANYRLSIVDGIVCVAMTQTDFNEPRLLTNHWPTKVREYDLAKYFGVEREAILAAKVRESFPGEYFVSIDGVYQSGCYLSLVDGSKTQSIKTDIADYPAPKNRGKRVEYRDGYWFKETAKGWKRHESM